MWEYATFTLTNSAETLLSEFISLIDLGWEPHLVLEYDEAGRAHRVLFRRELPKPNITTEAAIDEMASG